MTNISDRIKKSRGAGGNIPKLEIAHLIELKEDGGTPVFVSWNKEAKQNEVWEAPITGILIGQAIQMSSYSDDLGPKGGNYRSSYYFTKQNQIALFAPTSKGYEKVFSGTPPQAEAFINEKSTGNAKKKCVLFILNHEGLLAVSTNLTIAIDQRKTIADADTTNFIELVPALYSETDTPISQKSREYLGKFRTKNPPKFAFMTIGGPIKEEAWYAWKAEKHFDDFDAFKKFRMEGAVTTEADSEELAAPVKEEPKEEKPKTFYNRTANQMNEPSKGQQSAQYYTGTNKMQPNPKAGETKVVIDPADDLPF